MRFFVVMAVTAAVAAYGPPRPSTGGDSGCGSGCGSTTGGSQVVTTHVSPCPGGNCGSTDGGSQGVTTHVSPCPGGNCGGSSGSGGASSSGDYWWQGQANPFATLGKRPSSGSHSCSGAGCASGGTPCVGTACPSRLTPGPAPGPAPGLVPSSDENLLLLPMGICSASYICVNWQLCRQGLVIDDGTGIIDKQRKVIPPQIAATYTSCGGDMICCGLPDQPSQLGPGTAIQLPSPVSPPKFSGPGTPARPPTPISPPIFSGPGTPARPPTPVSPPIFSGPGTPARPPTPVSPPKFSGPGTPVRPPTPVSPPKFSGPGTPARPPTPGSPPKFSGSGTPARPPTPGSPPKFSGPGTPARPPTPVSPPIFSGPGTPARPPISVSPPKFSDPGTPARPSPQQPSIGYLAPGGQQPTGPSPLPSTVNQAPPVPPSTSFNPVSNPVGLPSPPSGQSGGMVMMAMPMGMMPRSGSCSAGTYCVAQQMCNPYNGFIIRGNTAVMAVWPDSPTVPLLPCFVPDGSITDGVCCQEAHPNAGGVD